ncbi:2TM domain-containing protein [Lacinutrix undariae]
MEHLNYTTSKNQVDAAYIKKEASYLRAKKKVDKIVGFYWHLASYVIINLFIIGSIAFNNPENVFRYATFSTAFFWGIGLLFHGLGVFGPDILFGKAWEDKKIKAFMAKDKQH